MFDETEYGVESLWSPDMAQYQGRLSVSYYHQYTFTFFQDVAFTGFCTCTYGHILVELFLFIVGPALYVYNDAVFTGEDWNGIQEIARSRKREDSLKVGRFGIGFNSVYHITGESCTAM